MSQADRDKIFEKIKKCMKLGASSNEHEAAAALRQAQLLMEKYEIDHADMLAYEACEARVKASVMRKPTSWEGCLAHQIADAFKCRLIFIQPGFWEKSAQWNFIGVDAAPEIAGYTFAVLLRQCKRARAAHIETNLRRCKMATKTRRADIFCEGWVHSVSDKIIAFVGGECQQAAIEAYVEKKYPSLRTMQHRDRNDGRKLSDSEHGDYMRGGMEGRNVDLNRGVDGGTVPLALR